MKRVIESAAPIWKDDINYPGVPADPPVAARTTSRATVTYETYVLQYAARDIEPVRPDAGEYGDE